MDEEGTYLKILWRSVEYAGLTTAICLVAGYPVAYWIGRCARAVAEPAAGGGDDPVLDQLPDPHLRLGHDPQGAGLLNGVLKAVGLIPHVFGQPLEILYTPTAVVIGLVYAYLPFMILPIYGSVEKLDGSLLEAALDLGAGPWRAFWRVILPLTRPGIAAGVMLVFVPAIGMFAVTDLMGGSTVPLIGNVIQNQFGQARDWPFGSALGITLLALFAVAFWAGGGMRRAREA